MIANDSQQRCSNTWTQPNAPRPSARRGLTLPLKGCSAAALFGLQAHVALRDCCLDLDKISERFVSIARTFACRLAQHAVCRSTRENESGAKTKPSCAKYNAFLRDDDAKSPTRNSGERGDKHRPRQATWRQSQDNRQMEGAGVHIRRENGSEESPLKPPHAPR